MTTKHLPKPIAIYLESVKGTPAGDEAVKLLGATYGSSGRPRRSPPFFIKRIEAIDPECPNGYGVDGDFVKLKDLPSHPYGTLFLLSEKTNDASKKLSIICRTPSTSSHTIKFASGKEQEISEAACYGEFVSYESLIEHLDKTCGVRHFVSDKRPKKKAGAA